jgi:two-component system CheB/CheR fusion protein
MSSKPRKVPKRKAGAALRGEAKLKGGALPSATRIRDTRTGAIPPIVGVGASAGGLEAFTQLLQALPPDTGMAFVLVQHLEARHESILARLLSGVTQMAIAEVKQGMRVQPSHVYVIPPNADITIEQGVLQLVRRRAPAGFHMPIDHFFRSLAEDQGARAIGVILSGTASDGTLGMKAIKAGGGVTFAQEPGSAKYDGMPRNAITAGCIDFVLTPESIAAELSQISRHPYLRVPPQEAAAGLHSAGEGDLAKILKILRAGSGVDFTYYKKSTIKRRIARRMAVHKIDSLSGYVEYLKDNRPELDALYQDILIHVTSFFREPDAFQALRETILPRILAAKSVREPLRIWVPGCSTGEEVYSIAICLIEGVANRAEVPPIQIFATDINDKAIEYARNGIYPESALQDVSKERLRRFFERSTEHYHQISTSVREMCVFARHDLTKDPPFSKLDLISCRNVLIYLEPTLQKRTLASFHYALKDKGFLLLGRSETLGGFMDLFDLVDRKNKFFAKKLIAGGIGYPMESLAYERLAPPARRVPGEKSIEDYEREADRLVWERYAHAGFVVDGDLQPLLVRGDTSLYLRPAPGRATLNLLKMLREELILEVRAAVQKARRTGTAVRREGIRLTKEAHLREVNIEVHSLAGPSAKDKRFLVLFESVASPAELLPESSAGRKRRPNDREIVRLNKELKRSKEYLQAIIQEQETTNEELKSSNEEALSSMEELQSTNEELETAKEELQSSNEELVTMNEQAQTRNSELGQLTDDLSNVLTGVTIPILLLGGDHRIRRFTPTAERLLHLAPADTGRPIADIRLRIDLPDIDELITDTIQREEELKREVRAQDGRWYLVRLCPYRTREHKIEGVLISFVDIDDLKQSQEALRRESNFVAAIVDAASRALLVVVLDRDRRIVRFNRACQELTGYSMEEAKGKPQDFLYLPEELEQVNAGSAELLEGRQREHQFHWVTKDGHRRLISWSNSVTRAADGTVEYMIRTGIDVTEHEQAKERVRESDATVRALMETAAQAILAVASDGRIALVNASAETMFGYERHELVGQPLELLIPKRFAERHISHRVAFFRDPKNRPMGIGLELAGLRKDGSEFSVEVSLSHVPTSAGILAVAFVSDITMRKQSEDALRESAARLRALSEGLLTAQEDERKRLARELHDDLNQRLAMLSVGVAELEAGLPDSALSIKDHLLALETSLAEVSEELRRAAYQLHPSVLEHLGLAAALEAHCEEVSKQGPVKIQFRHREMPKQIPEAVALCLYRVAQEALRNVIKHSGANRATVELTGNEKEVVLRITDKGRGFNLDEAGKRGGLGLVSMEERVRIVNGSLSIRAKAGDGTRVMIRIPLKAEAL